jgi:LysR family positive regulator for ilvC
MDIKSLRLFQHLAKSLSFTKTANAMYVSPPTLSRVISRLEEECGAYLFVRNNRSVNLTAAGLKVLSFAEQTLNNWQALEKSLEQQVKELSGQISVFCSVTASQSYLPPLLDKLQNRYPAIELKLDTGDPALAVNKVEEKQADFSFAIKTPDMPANITFNQLDTVPLVLIVPKSINISDVSELKWTEMNVVMPARGPSKRIVNHWFAEQGIRPRVYASVSGNEAIVSMVSLGLGVGFVPRIVLDNSVVKANVNVIEVSNIEPYSLGLCYLTQRANEPLLRAVTELFVA